MRKYKDYVVLTPEQLRQIRLKVKAQGFTQGAVAERFGMCRATLENYIYGRVRVPPFIYEKLKKLLNLKNNIMENKNE